MFVDVKKAQLDSDGIQRRQRGASDILPPPDLRVVVHGDDVTFEYGVDEKHSLLLLQGIQLRKDSKTVSSAAVKTKEMDPEVGEELEARRATMFRKLAATLNDMSMDRSDARFAAEDIFHHNVEALAGKLEEAQEHLGDI